MTRDCRVCYGAHDDSIHDASLSVHDWLRERVTFAAPLPASDKPLRVEKESVKGRDIRPDRVARVDRMRGQTPKPKAQRPGKSKSGLTCRYIVDCLKKGQSFAEIGRGAMVTFSAVARRLERCRDPKLKDEYAALLSCGCGKPKNPSAAKCYRCARKTQESRPKGELIQGPTNKAHKHL